MNSDKLKCKRSLLVIGAVLFSWSAYLAGEARSAERSSTAVQEALLRARKLLGMGDSHAAMRACSDALRLDNRSAAAHALFAVACEDTPIECIHYLEELHKAESLPLRSPTDYDAVGFACLKMSDSRRARAYIEKAVQMEPKNPSFLLDLAHAQSTPRETEEAAKTLKKVLALDPKFAPAYARVAHQECSKSEARLSEAGLKDFARSLKLDPNPAVYAERAKVYEDHNEYKLALADYDSALSSVARKDWMQKRAHLLCLLGRFGEAQALLNTPVLAGSDLCINTRLICDLGLAKPDAAYGELCQAIAALRELDVMTSDGYAGHLALAHLIWQTAGDLEFAKEIRTALRDGGAYTTKGTSQAVNKYVSWFLKPSRPIAPASLQSLNKNKSAVRALIHCWRGLIARQYKVDQTEAKANFDKALSLDPRSIEAYTGRSRVYVELGQFANAIADCNQALMLDPKCLEALRQKTLALESMKKDKEALDAYIRLIALRSKPRSVWEVLQLRDVLLQALPIEMKLKDYTAAKRTADQLLQIDPYSNNCLRGAAQVYLALNKPERALTIINTELAKEENSAERLKQHFFDVRDSYALRASIYDKLGKKDLADKDRQLVNSKMSHLLKATPFSSATPIKESRSAMDAHIDALFETDESRKPPKATK